MKNRPHIRWDAALPGDGDGGTRVGGGTPSLRLVLLFVALMIPLTAVSARLTRLQSNAGSQYVAAWETTTVHDEPIPCRDGRILAADGHVLAQDRLRFDVLVHYRWLEEPANERWLKQQALARLTRRQRRDAGQLAAAREAVLADRRRLWDLLAETTGRTRQQIGHERAGVQRRIERMRESVNQRQAVQLAEADAGESRIDVRRLTSPEATPEDWRQLKSAVMDELTTTPSRWTRESIVIQEELSHHRIVTDVDLRVVAAIESAPSLFPGARVQALSERVYPAGETAAHIVGFRTEATPDDRRAREVGDGDTLQAGDRLGRTGVERAFDQTLRGKRGRLRILKDRHGQVLSQSVAEYPVNGEDVVLTMDTQLQRTAERLLDEAIGRFDDEEASVDGPPTPAHRPNGGCLIAMDVRTGDVLTAAAAPRFAPGLFLHPDPDEWQAVAADPRHPFFPRVTQMTIPPGSVFKILTSIALLESRLIDPNAPVFCQGFLDHPHRNRCYIYRHYGVGHGDMTLSDALCQSCNVYFFHAARSLGPQPIADWAARFGFGVPTGGEVPGERGGHVPQAANGKIVGEQWYNGSTLQLAIGQATLTVTPLQVVRMVAAVANDGYLVTPRFVRDERDDQQTPSDSTIELVSHTQPTIPDRPLQRIPGLSAGTLARVREGMRLVIDHDRGTGKRVRIDGLSIAGKTGTAEVGGGKRDHAWFVGFVPADVPRYAFVVVLEHGGSGGSAAGPLAKAFIEAMLGAGVLSRKSPDS